MKPARPIPLSTDVAPKIAHAVRTFVAPKLADVCVMLREAILRSRSPHSFTMRDAVARLTADVVAGRLSHAEAALQPLDFRVQVGESEGRALIVEFRIGPALPRMRTQVHAVVGF